MDPSGRNARVAWTILAFLVFSTVAGSPHETRIPSSTQAAPSTPQLPKAGSDSPALRAAAPTAAGMVFRVDPETASLEVLTGVGLALRVLRFRCDESTVIQASGKPVRLASLKRGDTVRVVCRPDVQGNLAIRIELLPRPGAEGGPP